MRMSARATSFQSGPWIARIRQRVATSTSSGWIGASMMPTTTTFCSPARPTADSPGVPRSWWTRPREVSTHSRHMLTWTPRAASLSHTTTSATTLTGDVGLSTDLWITHSHNGGQTFPTETRLTPSSFDMRTAPYALGYFVGDYTGLAHYRRRSFMPAGSEQTTATSAIAPTFSTARRSEGTNPQTAGVRSA